jgi:hypothetical protein
MGLPRAKKGKSAARFTFCPITLLNCWRDTSVIFQTQGRNGNADYADLKLL